MPNKIHMDVDSVQAVIRLLGEKKTELEDAIREITIAVEGLEAGEWIGPAPDQFFGEYAELRTELFRQVADMGNLANFLRQAIADFEAAAAKLS